MATELHSAASSIPRNRVCNSHQAQQDNTNHPMQFPMFRSQKTTTVTTTTTTQVGGEAAAPHPIFLFITNPKLNCPSPVMKELQTDTLGDNVIH